MRNSVNDYFERWRRMTPAQRAERRRQYDACKAASDRMHRALAECRAALDDLDACDDGDWREDTSDGIRFWLDHIAGLMPMGAPAEPVEPSAVVMN